MAAQAHSNRSHRMTPTLWRRSRMPRTSVQCLASTRKSSPDRRTGIRGCRVYPDFQSIGSWQLSEGSWFNDVDESAAQPVAVIGETMVENLFTPTVFTRGQSILINSQAYQVVGVLQVKGANGLSNQDDVVYVPFAAAQERLNNSGSVGQIQLQVDDVNNVDTTQQDATTLLEQRTTSPLAALMTSPCAVPLSSCRRRSNRSKRSPSCWSAWRRSHCSSAASAS